MEIVTAIKPKTDSNQVSLGKKTGDQKEITDSKGFLARLIEKTNKLKKSEESEKQTNVQKDSENSKNIKNLGSLIANSQKLLTKKISPKDLEVTPRDILVKEEKLKANNLEKDLKKIQKDKDHGDDKDVENIVNLIPVEQMAEVKIKDIDIDKKDIKKIELVDPKNNIEIEPKEENSVPDEAKKNLKIDGKEVLLDKQNKDTNENDKKNYKEIDRFIQGDKVKGNQKVTNVEPPRVLVSDVRTKNNKQEISQKNNIEIVKKENLVKEVSDVEIKEQKIILGTTEIRGEGDGAKGQAPVSKEAIPFLKQQLSEFGNDEIVKQSRYILKDNNVGEIKLILKPESLGEVKINLNLKENGLAGQIIVENNSVRELFQQNLQDLSKALVASGFDSAELNISLGDKGESNQGKKENNKQFFSERLKKFEESGQVIRYGLPTAGINLTA